MIRNFYVTKLIPFSLKGDAKAWYDALPCGSIKSPQDLAQYFVAKYFLAHMLLYKEFITLNSYRMRISLKLGADFAVC